MKNKNVDDRTVSCNFFWLLYIKYKSKGLFTLEFIILNRGIVRNVGLAAILETH